MSRNIRWRYALGMPYHFKSTCPSFETHTCLPTFSPSRTHLSCPCCSPIPRRSIPFSPQLTQNSSPRSLQTMSRSSLRSIRLPGHLCQYRTGTNAPKHKKFPSLSYRSSRHTLRHYRCSYSTGWACIIPTNRCSYFPQAQTPLKPPNSVHLAVAGAMILLR